MDTDLVLAQFGRNRSIARRRYRGFILEGVDGGHEAKLYEGSEGEEIAEHFRRSPMRISQAIIEMEERLHHDESLKRVVNRLEKDLSKDA